MIWTLTDNCWRPICCVPTKRLTPFRSPPGWRPNWIMPGCFGLHVGQSNKMAWLYLTIVWWWPPRSALRGVRINYKLALVIDLKHALIKIFTCARPNSELRSDSSRVLKQDGSLSEGAVNSASTFGNNIMISTNYDFGYLATSEFVIDIYKWLRSSRWSP